RLVLVRFDEGWVDRPATKVGFVLHSLLVLALTVANPFSAIYSIVGYLDGGRWFRGRWATGVVVVTAVLCAFGQAGGLYGLRDIPGGIGRPGRGERGDRHLHGASGAQA